MYHLALHLKAELQKRAHNCVISVMLQGTHEMVRVSSVVCSLFDYKLFFCYVRTILLSPGATRSRVW
jgi:hypothetical protein